MDFRLFRQIIGNELTWPLSNSAFHDGSFEHLEVSCLLDTSLSIQLSKYEKKNEEHLPTCNQNDKYCSGWVDD